MSSDTPDVTVIIPTRDRWDVFRASALRAALCQEGVSLEVVVVDDGSNDGTQASLATLQEDTRIRVLRNEMSRGVSAARNRGIQLAAARWVAFLDDDDLWDPQKLHVQITRAEDQGAGFVFSSAVTLGRRRRPVAYRFVPSDSGDLVRLLCTGNPVPAGASNVVVRRDLVQDVGGFDERLSMVADRDLWLRLALAAPAACCSEVHVGYVQHDENMAVRHPSDVFREARLLTRKYAAWDSLPSQVDGSASVRWIAWANFWAGNRGRAARIALRSGVRERLWTDLSLGLRFLVWASVPDRWARTAWRLRHGRDRAARASAEPPPAPEWLTIYDDLPAVEAG